jgi:hypothetical protein
MARVAAKIAFDGTRDVISGGGGGCPGIGADAERGDSSSASVTPAARVIVVVRNPSPSCPSTMPGSERDGERDAEISWACARGAASNTVATQTASNRPMGRLMGGR